MYVHVSVCALPYVSNEPHKTSCCCYYAMIQYVVYRIMCVDTRAQTHTCVQYTPTYM